MVKGLSHGTSRIHTATKMVNRRTDNILTKRKTTKGQTMIYKALNRKLKIEQHEPH